MNSVLKIDFTEKCREVRDLKIRKFDTVFFHIPKIKWINYGRDLSETVEYVRETVI